MLNSGKKIKVLVTDDSLVFRSFLSNTLRKDPDIEVVGTAMDGQAAISTIPLLKPDIVTLDIEMPRMNGIDTLKEIKSKFPKVQVIMCSSHTREGADITIQAMELGASDFILKENQEGIPLTKKTSGLHNFLTSKIKRAYKNSAFFTTPKKTENSFRVKKTLIESAQELIIPGSKPLCFPIACEERQLGHLLLLVRHLKIDLNVPIIFKILVPDVFLTSLIKSFERGNPNFSYLIEKGTISLSSNKIYLLGENHQINLSIVKNKLDAEIQNNKSKVTINNYFDILKTNKLPNTPIFLIGDDIKSDGVKGLELLTQKGFPTVFITRRASEFKNEEGKLANKIIDLNIMINFMHSLFGVTLRP